MQYQIILNDQYKSYEVYFSEKPDTETRNKLKALKFRWNHKKCVWYGFSERETLESILSGGIKPDGKIDPIVTGGEVSDGYMGANRWDGINSDKEFKLQDVNKYIKQLCRKNYGVDVRTRYQSFSGGQSTEVTILVNENDFISFEKLWNKRSENLNSKFTMYINRWAFSSHDWKYGHDYNWDVNFNRQSPDERKETISVWYEWFQKYSFNIMIDYEDSFCEFFNENVKNAAKESIKILKSFNYNDSNGMVDYFCTNFYWNVYIKNNLD